MFFKKLFQVLTDTVPSKSNSEESQVIKESAINPPANAKFDWSKTPIKETHTAGEYIDSEPFILSRFYQEFEPKNIQHTRVLNRPDIISLPGDRIASCRRFMMDRWFLDIFKPFDEPKTIKDLLTLKFPSNLTEGNDQNSEKASSQVKVNKSNAEENIDDNSHIEQQQNMWDRNTGEVQALENFNHIDDNEIFSKKVGDTKEREMVSDPKPVETHYSKLSDNQKLEENNQIDDNIVRNDDSKHSNDVHSDKQDYDPSSMYKRYRKFYKHSNNDKGTDEQNQIIEDEWEDLKNTLRQHSEF